MAAHAQTRPERKREREREREEGRGSREAARRIEGNCAGVEEEAAGIFCL
jgi:hypothetical protein